MSAKNNFFLVIEGLDGSGKTEMSRRLTINLKVALSDDFGKTVKFTREPHDPSCAGLFIRQTLTHRINPKPAPLTIALAFAANRLDHCDRVINPFFEDKYKESQHHVVICDRYYLSSLVYQSDENLSIDEVMKLNREALKPDLILFLNASNKICSERMKKRKEEKEMFEKSLSETRSKYHSAIEYLKSQGVSIEEVDANGDYPEVLANMINAINPYSPGWLNIQPALQLNYEPQVINVNGGTGITLAEEAQKILNKMMPFQIMDSTDMNSLLTRAEEEAKQKIVEADLDDLGYLFLDYLRTNGFVITDKFAWSDVDAFGVDMAMPLNITQKGIVILGNEIHQELIIQKKIAYNNFDSLNFVLLFLPSWSQRENYFEGEFVSTADQKVISPNIKRFYMDDLVMALTLQFIDLLQDEFAETITAFPNIRQALYSFWGVRTLK